MKILFVEDEAAAMLGVTTLLNARGHQIDEVGTADEAIERMRKTAYDLLIFDVMLRQLSKELIDVSVRQLGKELLVRLRNGTLGSLATNNNVPVVMITAVADSDVIDVLIASKNTLVLYKPIDPEDVLFEIESFISRGQKRNA